jgi:pimeloyl-ACP methyl ester carboxylesterase
MRRRHIAATLRWSWSATAWVARSCPKPSACPASASRVSCSSKAHSTDGDRATLVERATQAIDHEGFHAYAGQHFRAMFNEDSDAALRERIVARLDTMDPGFARSLYLEAVGWDPLRAQATLDEIDVPVLVIQSTHVDSHFQRRPMLPTTRTPFLDAVAATCPQVETTVITGCGHFPMNERPEAVNSAITAFARRIAS